VANDLLTTEEVAALCRTTQSTVHDWRLRGVGPRGMKVGRKVLYRRVDLQEWLDSRY